MGRSTRGRSFAPYRPKPVEKIELSEKNTGRRLFAAAVFLLFGISVLIYALLKLLNGDPGWTQIEVNSSAGVTYGQEFVFLYDVGAAGVAAPAEKRALTTVYTEAMETAYQLFSNAAGDAVSVDGQVHGVRYINNHPNEIIPVDDVLYQAFGLFEKYGRRELYLGPLYEVYNNLFYCADDSGLVDFDPRLSPLVASQFAEILEYANNPSAVNLELLEDNRVRLNVSEDYLNYAMQEEFTDFIDFYWMRNAFIIDYLADMLIQKGYTNGSISSEDGFVRNLDTRETSLSFHILDKNEDHIYQAATMQYTGPVSLVYLRNYRLSASDSQRYYELDNGEIRTQYIDIRDGLDKSALPGLVSYSWNTDIGCAEILMEMIPCYIGNEFYPEMLDVLSEEGIYSVYCQDHIICYNDTMLKLVNVYAEQGYTTSLQ